MRAACTRTFSYLILSSTPRCVCVCVCVSLSLLVWFLVPGGTPTDRTYSVLCVALKGQLLANASASVMFWIYGGAFVVGDDNEFGMYDGRRIAATREVCMYTMSWGISKSVGFTFRALPLLGSELEYARLHRHPRTEEIWKTKLKRALSVKRN